MTSPIADKVAKAIYYPFTVALMVFMLLTCIYSYGLIISFHSYSIEPQWTVAISKHIGVIGKIFNPIETDASAALDSLIVAITGLVMGLFLKKSTEKKNTFEVVVIVLCVVFGLIQLVAQLILPKPQNSEYIIVNAQEVLQNISIILSRNSNVCLAIAATALGIRIFQNKDENENGDQNE